MLAFATMLVGIDEVFAAVLSLTFLILKQLSLASLERC